MSTKHTRDKKQLWSPLITLVSMITLMGMMTFLTAWVPGVVASDDTISEDDESSLMTLFNRADEKKS